MRNTERPGLCLRRAAATPRPFGFCRMQTSCFLRRHHVCGSIERAICTKAHRQALLLQRVLQGRHTTQDSQIHRSGVCCSATAAGASAQPTGGSSREARQSWQEAWHKFWSVAPPVQVQVSWRCVPSTEACCVYVLA